MLTGVCPPPFQPVHMLLLHAGMQFDWDDAAGDAMRRDAGLKLEAMRLAEQKRLRLENRGKMYKQGPSGGRKQPAAAAMPPRESRSSNGKA